MDPNETWHGRWWLPGESDRPLGGTLEFGPDRGGRLRLHGGLRGDAATHFPEVLFGDTDKGRVTLLDAVQVGHASRWGAGKDEITSESWRCNSLALGAHLADGFETSVLDVAVETQLLPWWVRRPHTEREEEYAEREHILRIEHPEEIDCKVPGARMSLRWQMFGTGGYLSRSVTVEPSLGMRPDAPIPLSRVWRKCVMPVLFLTTLATGQPDALTRVTVRDSLERMSSSIDVRFSRWWATSERSDVRHWEFPVPFELFESRFEEMLRRWFLLMEQAEPALLEYFSIPLTPGMFLEDAFNRQMRSMEMFHRSVVSTRPLGEDEYSELLAKIRGGLDEAEWAFVQPRLQYGNEWTQKARLDQMIESVGEPVGPLIQSFKKFSRRVVDRRNQMTHGTDGRPVALSDEFTVWARECLSAIFLGTLLGHLGLSNDERAEAVRRSGIWAQVSWPGNVWIAESLGNLG